MSDSRTTATPEKTNATSTDHPPVRENQREMLQGRGSTNEAEVEQGAMTGQLVMRAIGGGSPAAPPEQFAEALGGVPERSQAGLWRQMQRGYGNNYVGKVIQAKLSVNQPGDSYEQEADRMAAQVMATPQSDRSIQREIDPKKEKEKIQMKPSLQLSPDGNQEAVGNLEGRLNSSKGGGSPLPDDVRSFMEPRFGADFSQVRVHTGRESVQMNQALDAQAFTHKQDVYFGSGKAPGKDALTAHELAHVLQQSPTNTWLQLQNKCSHSLTHLSTLSFINSSIQRQSVDPPARHPNTIVPLSSDPAEKHEASDAIVENFRNAAREIEYTTRIDLTKNPGDTTRPMSSRTSKPGASNFSWHKTGRAIDINQSHKWVIVKEPANDGMQFRIFLKRTGGLSPYERVFSTTVPTEFLVNPYGSNIFRMQFVDVTQVLIDHGFSRIIAQDGWEGTQTKQEWWHYEKLDHNTMYQALLNIHTEAEIITAYSSLVTNRSTGKASTQSLVRLHNEGFPYDVIQKISPNTNNAEREIELAISRAALHSRNISEKNYIKAALYLNGLNEADINRELRGLRRRNPDANRRIHEAAAIHPELGSGSNIYRLTGI